MNAKKSMLEENFELAIKFEEGMSSLGNKINNEENKSGMSSKKSMIQNPNSFDTKDKDSTNLTNLHKVIQKLSNEVLDLKKAKGEDASGKKYYKPYHKPRNQTPPLQEELNFNEYAMDDYCRAHQDNHSKNYCKEFINMYKIFTSPTYSYEIARAE